MICNFKKKFQPLSEGRPVGLKIILKLLRSGFLVSFLTISVCFLLLEIICKSLGYGYKKSPGPNNTYTIEGPEFKIEVKTNSMNLRDYEIKQKEEGEFRILCLGDSFTFGVGVNMEDTYGKILQKTLASGKKDIVDTPQKNRNAAKYRVINGGGGYASASYNFLVSEGIGLKPDLVIVQIYIGNDFYDEMLNPDTKDFVSSKNNSELLLEKLKYVLKRKSYTVDFLMKRLIQIRPIEDLLIKTHLRYTNRGIFLKEYPPLEEKLVKIELENFKKITELCDKEKIRILFIIVPSKAQVFKGDLISNEKYYYKKPNDIIKKFCRENNILYIDFLDNYEKIPPEIVSGFYYKIDIHWTAQGHKYAGEILAGVIKDTFNCQ